MKKKLIVGLLAIPLIIFSAIIGVVYFKQDAIVQHLISTANKDLNGKIKIQGSHIALFQNFPYISIDLEGLSVFENSTDSLTPILQIDDAYIGFNIFEIITGNYDIKTLKIEGGFTHLIQELDGSFNITNAFTGAAADTTTNTSEEGLKIHLKKVQLVNIDLQKFNRSTNTTYDVFINNTTAAFEANDDGSFIDFKSTFTFNVIQNGDTNFIKNKHFNLNTQISFIDSSQVLTIAPSKLYLEQAEFGVSGTIDFKNDVYCDLAFAGSKPNFDLFIALAPNELVPTLKKYKNQGKVYFDAKIKGKSINGNTPKIDVNFGCSEAYFTNTLNSKKLDELQFKGHFTNGEQRNLSTMQFQLQDFSAKPETGVFIGDLKVTNFAAPDIDLKLISQFELDFLANFLNLQTLQDLKGKVKLTMNFRDIIDLENPEKSIEKLNESYFTELDIKNLSFKSPDYHLPIKSIDVSAIMDGAAATINHLRIKAGRSDIELQGTVSDLPAIIHHTSKEVTTNIKVKANFIDLFELTNNTTDSANAINEQIKNLHMDLSLISSAKALTESPNLPVGEFLIKNLTAQMQHYPHTLKDFNADVLIGASDFNVIDFKGVIDVSDFHFSGKLENYDLWFSEKPKGDTKIEFDFDSDLLQLKDVFAYKGELFVPEDYRHESFSNLRIHGYADLHFNDSLYAADVHIDKLQAKMQIHPMLFRDFGGRLHLEGNNLNIKDARGKVGNSDFLLNMNYYLGADSVLKNTKNYLSITANKLDFDQLTNFNSSPAQTEVQNHDSAFNIYTLPFPNMKFDFNIDELTYHRYKINNFHAQLRTQANHYLYIDTLSLLTAGGSIQLNGYFNGSNPNLIYLKPNMAFQNIDIDKLLFKFENFGQDYIVNEQLHGLVSGTLTGNIHMHTDMVPSIDDSEVHLDFTVVNGSLENYDPLNYASDYFQDKNLNKVRFDTLSNHIDVVNGKTTIPNMYINSSLGYLQFSGEQDINGDFEYYFKIPFSLVKQATMSKLFAKKSNANDSVPDAIVRKDTSKKSRYLNIKMIGDSTDYKVSLGKQK